MGSRRGAALRFLNKIGGILTPEQIAQSPSRAAPARTLTVGAHPQVFHMRRRSDKRTLFSIIRLIHAFR